ncbi:MAG: hypothetical protein SGPRY_014128, partial [Prymnesium sp.]
ERGLEMAARLARAHDFVLPPPGSAALQSRDALKGVLCTPNASLVQVSDGRFLQVVGICAASAKPLQVELSPRAGVRARAGDRITNPFPQHEGGDIEGNAFKQIILRFLGGVFTNGRKQVRVLETESNDAGIRRVRFEEIGDASTSRPKRSTSTIIQFLKEFPPLALEMVTPESRVLVRASTSSFDMSPLPALTAAAKRELNVALNLCGGESLSMGERSRLLRAHCIAPTKSKGVMPPFEQVQQRTKVDSGSVDEDDDDTSDSASDDDNDEKGDEGGTHQDSRKRTRQVSLPPDTEGDSSAGEEEQVIKTKKVKMSPSMEVELLVPRSSTPGEFISILF